MDGVCLNKGHKVKIEGGLVANLKEYSEGGLSGSIS